LPDKYYLSNKEKTSLLISVLSFIIALCSISVSNLSIGVMAAVILVLSSLYIFPAKTYLTVSIAVFVALTLNTPDALNVYAMIPVGILIASLFGKKNRLMCYLIFAAVVSVGSLYSGYNLLTVPTLLDIIVGIVLCTFIPLERISRKSSDEKYSAAMDISLKNMVESKLGCASDCLMQIADTINELSDTKNESSSYSDGEILSGVCDKICFKCSQKLYCWSDRYSDTTDAFYKSIKHIKLGHTDPKDIFPSYFLSKCTNALEIMTMVSDSLKETAQKKISGRNMTAAKSAIVESYRCLSYLLNEVSDEITSMESIDADGLTVFSEILENYEIKDAHGVCERHDSGKFKFRFEGSDVAPKTIAKIKSDLEESFGIKLSAAHISKKKDGCEIEFSEAHIFSIEGAALQNCNRKEKVCGDSFKTFTSKSGNHFSVLCDGMGSGKNAAIDAIMCSEALSEMLLADIPIKSVMKIVNSMIESKSEDESSCAIDVLKIDSYTGEAHIIKAGGVVSIIKQDGKIKKVIGESMPIGILSEIQLFEKKLKLRSGDVVLTVSDGALELGTEWLEGILFSDRSGDPKEISKKIERELIKSIHAFSDDISILITAII
jgi:stage II sporulation protein E